MQPADTQGRGHFSRAFRLAWLLLTVLAMYQHDPRFVAYPDVAVGAQYQQLSSQGVVYAGAYAGSYSAMGPARKTSVWPAVLGALCLLAGLALAVPYVLGALDWVHATSSYTALAESAKREARDVEAARQSVVKYRSRAVTWGALAALSFGGAVCCFAGGFVIDKRR